MFSDICNPYLVTIFFAWFGSHIVKYATESLKHGKKNFRSHLFMSGGMPSSHSATAVALMSIVGLRDGVDSAVFGVAALFALIVTYDAAKVRRSSGEQGKALHKLIKEQNSNIKPPYTANGHTPLEVFVGGLFGLLIGIIVYLLTI